ncbi:exodeoxyribonuclease V beta chain [Buchnera aphidicola str. Bp (Baizongia pistaciae)]|uniref:RecBCD enzyme subunit RecB n=1 Tax=Buchnera aphidicola subsp. Baizongia pistaciae (strain Bp) TaxID=224915 RepID=RECB_BUCBP|nr:exodeoxyribonuclease V subunit beta [Buchnera aphidicola]Q89AB3.1 RecName: Full=RecBCD enzyme subunit RecB; AltName: Full=Exonuclease V subunit RecB; Short=ExoV subunit RecB; AltName: Full=Helicase/nuclease RecBCD subunit RecB [Buchnera aphidicola str. Bp (Baizongia pistaciae)]AAO27116.1 exodeoxyribonuclease V beta chain [Buchnera aphidicola str. Bp (Baizongia pistaciae)]
MITTIPKSINVTTIPLSGKILIEASAGTGKTFSLTILYIRLLLGITNHVKYKKGLLIKEILVVTFTEHTRAELEIRIKTYIKIFKTACIKKYSNNYVLSKLLSKITDFPKTIDILSKAENSIHELSIYTIHGFCYKILKLNKFNSELMLQNKILKHTYPLYLKISIKFWKYYFAFLSLDITSILLEYFNNPKTLLKEILPLLNKTQLISKLTKTKRKNIVQEYYILIKKIKLFKQKWANYSHLIHSEIIKTNVNKRIYTKSNLKRWINNITAWATQKQTKNFFIPSELKYFRYSFIIKKTTSEKILDDKFFKFIDTFLDSKFSLKEIFIIDASLEIKAMFMQEKIKNRYFEYDDLITFCWNMVNKNNFNISQTILKKYPVALIDEFQDTNNKQYNIFKKIYKKENLLILISDPKQAIYSFSGADITSYLQAKSNIKNQYFLDTNWRSSPKIINSINLLFSRLKNPFLTKNITFYPVKSSRINKTTKFEVNGKNQPALRFLLNKNKNISINEYKEWISITTAKYISYWISSGIKGNATITISNKVRTVNFSDIAIIVRNNLEAKTIQLELTKLNIQSLYLTSKNNIFQSKEILEILWILQAILNPNIERLLKRAMSTNIMSKNTKEIISIPNNHSYWIKLSQEFNQYLIFWNNYGILYVIQQLIINYNISNNNNLLHNFSPNIKNILYIGELLEEKSITIKNKFLLINWLKKNITQDFYLTKPKYIKPNYEKNNYIKIVSIHKSKGLEYPITIIPFATITFNKTVSTVEKICFNLNNTKIKKQKTLKIEKHKFSEDIRLLYVALTRSIIHCSIGISLAQTITQKKKIQKEKSKFKINVLRYIIQSGKNHISTKKLYTELSILKKNKNIEIISEIPNIIKKNFQIPTLNTNSQSLMHYQVSRKFNYNYNFTSYSQLKKNIKPSTMYSTLNTKKLFELNVKKKHCFENKILTPHTFPSGKIYGTLLHKILKNISFHKSINSNWLLKKLSEYNLDKRWCLILKNWMYSILYKNLDKNYNLRLSKLDSKNYIKELKFLLPIKKKLTALKLNNIFQTHQCSSLENKLCFHPIQGILSGSIDLVFLWKTKYFLVDYKSNWIGNSNQSYSQQNIKKIIKKHHYNFQLQLYSLVLHRYLKQHIKNYSFYNHFGGTYILFIRSINEIPSQNGIFYSIPNIEIIKKLEQIF